MGDIRNCPRCGKIFEYVGVAICRNCIQADEDEFKIVKDYIYENPGASIGNVSEATGVKLEKIMRYLRDERLEIASNNENLFLHCERCQVPIKSGRYCDSCKRDLEMSFRHEFGLDKKPEPKMQGAGSYQSKSSEEKMYTAVRRR